LRGEQSEEKRGKRGWLLLLLGLVLVRGLLYAAVVPPWQAPDETGHFEYAWLIAHLGRLPAREDVSPALERELLGSLYEWRYGEFIGRPLPEQMPARMDALPPQVFASRCRTVLMERFSLAYVWAAIFIWPFRHQDLAVQLYAARFASVLLELGIVWLAWRFFEELLPRQRRLVVAMTAFVAFLPQHTFINASVGEGPLAELATCAVLYGWLRLFHRKAHFGTVMLIVVGTLVGMCTKHTAAFLLPFDLLALGLFLSARIQGVARRRRLGYLALGLSLTALLGWLILQTPVGHSVQDRLQQWWSAPQVYLENGPLSLDQALWWTYDSFWAQFGWMSVRAGACWYILVYVLTVLALEGWFLPRSRQWSVPAQARWLLGAALSLAVAVWLAFVLFTPSGLAYYQGRYLFPAIVPAAFVLVGGWARWTPERWRRYFAPGVVILLAALDAAAVCLSLWPFFYA